MTVRPVRCRSGRRPACTYAAIGSRMLAVLPFEEPCAVRTIMLPRSPLRGGTLPATLGRLNPPTDDSIDPAIQTDYVAIFNASPNPALLFPMVFSARPIQCEERHSFFRANASSAKPKAANARTEAATWLSDAMAYFLAREPASQ